MTEPVRHDWPGLIAALRNRGLSYWKIAEALAVNGRRIDWKQVKRWADGVEPGHFDGELLLALHAEMIHVERGEMPLSRSDKTEIQA